MRVTGDDSARSRDWRQRLAARMRRKRRVGGKPTEHGEHRASQSDTETLTNDAAGPEDARRFTLLISWCRLHQGPIVRRLEHPDAEANQRLTPDYVGERRVRTNRAQQEQPSTGQCESR